MKKAFMNIAKTQTEAHYKMMNSDFWMGVDMGCKIALLEMANLPDLKDDNDVKNIVDRLNACYPSLKVDD